MVHMTTNALSIPGHRYVPRRGLNAWAFRYPNALRRRAGLRKNRHSNTEKKRWLGVPEGARARGDLTLIEQPADL
jgi:hypothetical protein